MIHPIRFRPFLFLLAVAALLAGPVIAQKQEEVVLNFTGVLKSLTAKQIVIEPDPDNSMTFVRTKRTRVVEHGKETDGAKVEKGAVVRVDCTMRMNGDLEALAVTVIELDDHSPNK